MIAATLFSGIGAPEVAMPHWLWTFHAEIEKFPSAVMKARHPMSVNLGDVNAEDFVERAIKAGRPDCIVFGSPCQDFSVAGKRVGLDGARGNMALVALSIIAKLRPRWVVFENVPGLLSSYSGSADAESEIRNRDYYGDGGQAGIDAEEDSDFAAFLAAVQECGYLGVYRTTDAQFAGVPQRRRRIFAVFHLGDWRPAAAVLLEPASMRGDHPPSREAGEGLAPTIASRPSGGGGLGTDFDCDGGLIAGAVSAKWAKGTGGPAGDECYNLVAFDLQQATSPENRSQLSPDQTPTMGAAHQMAVAYKSTGNNGVYSTGDKIDTLSNCKDPNHDIIAFTAKDYGADATEGHSPTLRSMSEIDGNANGGGQIAVAFKPSHYTRDKDGAPADVVPALSKEADRGDQESVLFTGVAVRRLTPMECERLQAFPDNYTLIEYRGKPAADGPRYKALGNAMCVAEVRWVLSRIEQFEKEYRIAAIVKGIEEKEQIVEVKKDGTKSTVSLGWWVTIKGANASFSLGDERPDMEPGDELLLTIEKRNRR